MSGKFETKYGCFSNNGNEYVVKTPKTPKPWINVISNGDYGLTISQTCGGFSWLTHSEMNRLTRWHQDLIKDNWGKYLYIRDEETGKVWNPGWLPIKTDLDFYECRHGFGYSVFTSECENIRVELTIFIPFDEQHEIWKINIRNLSNRERQLSFYTYFEWCLGASNDYHREFHKNFLETEFDSDLNALLAKKRLWEIPIKNRGHWNIEYPYTAFHACNKNVAGFEGDKESFLGQYGSLSRPSAVMSGKLTGKTGAWNDSIGSLHVKINLESQQEEQFAFFLGLGKNKEQIQSTLNKYKDNQNIDKSLAETKKRWNKLFNTLTIETPDEAMNFMVNKWLKYQSISCRLWARTAYYQQSGAFGFRDQLQDSQIFLPIDPSLTGMQIKLHAKHQFENGTVLHWWHPITEEGLKNQLSDNLLWLPFLIVSYLDETNNYDFLDEEIEYFDDSEKKESIFKHCCKAINAALSRLSERGLSLIGAGDWNDGLSAVGLNMKGESIWLSQFLYFILTHFVHIAKKHGFDKISDSYYKKAKEINSSIENYGWDGNWYFRATKDNGDKLGSNECREGKIYLNPQIWSVISESASSERQQKAMSSVKKYLIKDYGPFLLFPAYKKSDQSIGYLSRYAPGSRENGGVYTHAATWSIWAFTKLKQSGIAYEIFRKVCPIINGMEPDRYKGEPYVTPGNIDGPESAHYGRGSWTWYTGSAAWFQKVIVDWILGIRATEEGLLIDPCIPKEWESFKVKRLFRGTYYQITVSNPRHNSSGVKNIRVNGSEVESNLISPVKGKECFVEIIL